MATHKRGKLLIHCLSLPQISTEWVSILGDKYLHALTFDLELTDDPHIAQVIVWDGIISKKMQSFLPDLKQIVKDKILILAGESLTLMKNDPMVTLANLEAKHTIELPGWTVLPEQILASLEVCYRNIEHV